MNYQLHADLNEIMSNITKADTMIAAGYEVERTNYVRERHVELYALKLLEMVKNIVAVEDIVK